MTCCYEFPFRPLGASQQRIYTTGSSPDVKPDNLACGIIAVGERVAGCVEEVLHPENIVQTIGHLAVSGDSSELRY
jgi:hypothetical protein